MSIAATKRTLLSVFSHQQDVYSHQVRIVLAEKGVNVEIHSVDPKNLPEDLLDLNPYASVPTLVDRSLVLYEARIIMEYLDERFPHPPLLPVYPVERAKSRLMAHRIEKDWYTLMRIIEKNNVAKAEQARNDLRDSLTELAPVFAQKPFFLSEDFSLIDCCIAPLLWRLPKLGIELPKSAKAVSAYAARVFERDSFQASLTEHERELQEA